jgi:hypothetical protein
MRGLSNEKQKERERMQKYNYYENNEMFVMKEL